VRKVLYLLNLALALQACSRSHPASSAQIQETLNSSAQVAAVNSQSGQTLVHDQSVQNSNLRTEKFKYYDQGIEVLGSGVSYHESVGHSETGQVTAHISPISNGDFSTTPGLSSAQAVTVAQKLEKGSVVGSPTLKILPSSAPSQTNKLIYQVHLDTGKQVWLDAHQGTHIATLGSESKAQDDSQNNYKNVQLQVMSALHQGIQVSWSDDDSQVQTCQISQIESQGSPSSQTFDSDNCDKQTKSSCQALDGEGEPTSLNPQSCANDSDPTQDPSAERALENAQKFLKYFHEVHDRDSYDGKGAPIVSMVHVGQLYADAIWDRDRHFLVYGDGDGKTTRDFTFALDIAGHELTHGVIQASAGLVAMGETGALNESIADFFGKMVEGQGDWTIGSALGLNPGYEGLRDLKNPARLQGEYLASDDSLQNKPYPSTRAQEAPIVYPCTEDNDSCAVHFNATIPGHAWYGLYQSLGKAKAEKLMYITLTHFLTELADFAAAAQATEQACATFLSGPECQQVKEILTNSGMLVP
jgi:Zn-dependent metalloprotease